MSTIIIAKSTKLYMNKWKVESMKKVIRKFTYGIGKRDGFSKIVCSTTIYIYTCICIVYIN